MTPTMAFHIEEVHGNRPGWTVQFYGFGKLDMGIAHLEFFEDLGEACLRIQNARQQLLCPYYDEDHTIYDLCSRCAVDAAAEESEWCDEPLHDHHDGCPVCDNPSSTSEEHGTSVK